MGSRLGLSVGFISILSLLLTTRGVCHGHIPARIGQCSLNIPSALQPQTHLGCSHLVDEDVTHQPIDYSPWTHPVDCMHVPNSPSTKYCVFSIITTPEIAATEIEILNDSGDTQFRSVNSSAGPAWKVVDIPGKGKGIVASRFIKRSEAIMVDWASLVVHLDFPTSVKRLQGYRHLHRAVDQLSDPDRVLELARSSTFSNDIVEDVLRTNAFSYPLAGESHMALYPDVSRVNHACRPNAFIRFTPTSLAVSVVVQRDIEPGEEITITCKTRDERQELLLKWGFQCSCDLCTASKAEVAASDYRREKIRNMRQEVMKAVEVWDGTKAAKLTLETLELMRDEDLAPLYASQYEILARLYWKAKDKKMGTKYAQMSIDTLVDQGYIENSTSVLPALLESFDG
ncbi:SET domain-containing protein [Hypoxylon rubiginosum]|uniref:SET domain-containing protein n=1 Tax=Hypoxylon rubiginosum TaxID=110542 RepID=A0ACC0D221_9PEZI|nr:SET domain-containing protein [Hypoxylon rubiginosum]